MYRKILVALDTTASDLALIPHVAALADLAKAELLLLHVADGWVARNFDQLNLAESEEMKNDWAYLERAAKDLREANGLTVSTRLALGSPWKEILHVADEEKVDLIALASHGHRLMGDILHGSTIDAVRHRARVPMLVVAAPQS